MKTFAILPLLVACGIPICLAYQDKVAPEKQLDFWVGEWIVTDTTPNAKNPPGRNTIQRLYGGKVIHENFKMGTFEGQSWSVYNPKQQAWHQTWVDNNGGYIAMKSYLVDGKLAIQTLKSAAAPDAASRMVFHNVRPDSFTWRWEATKDGGKTWTLSWQLEYKRKKGSAQESQALLKAISVQNRLESNF